MIKIFAYYDGCGEEFSFDNANGSAHVHAFIDVNEKPLVSNIESSAFRSCLKELSQVSGIICEQVAKSQRRHDHYGR